MQSKTSCFNSAVVKNDLRRSWPLWGSCTLLWVMLVPVAFVLNDRNGNWYSNVSKSESVLNALYSMANAAVILNAVYGVVAAMLLFSGLYAARAACGVHALPVTRPQLFCGHCTAALVIIAIPTAVMALLTLPVLAFLGVNATGALARLCLVLLGSFVWCFGFAVFCGMFTGQILALPIFYGILSLLPILLQGMWQSFCLTLLYGYRTVDPAADVALILSPIAKLCSSVNPVTDAAGHNTLSGLSWVLVYAAVGAVLLAVSLQLYKKRQLEQAGETVTLAFARVLFRFGACVCTAMTASLVLSNLLGVGQSGVGLFLCALPGAIFGFFGAQMLLQKSLRVSQKSLWMQLSVVVALLGLVLGILCTGGLGYVRRVPQADRVKSACVSVGQVYGPVTAYARGFTVTDPEQLNILTEYHRNLLEVYADSYRQKEQASAEKYQDESLNWGIDYGEAYLQLDYTLASGAKQSRSYTVYLTKEGLREPDSLESRLQSFVNQNYDPQQELLRERARLTLSAYANDSTGNSTGTMAEYRADSTWANRILDALAEDFAKVGKQELTLLQEPAQLCAYEIDLYGYGETGDWLSYEVYVNADTLPKTAAALNDALTNAPEGEGDWQAIEAKEIVG